VCGVCVCGVCVCVCVWCVCVVCVCGVCVVCVWCVCVCGKEHKYSGLDMDPSTRLCGIMHHKRILNFCSVLMFFT